MTTRSNGGVMEGIFQVDTQHGMLNVFGVPRHILDVIAYDFPVMILGQNGDGSFSVIPIMPIDPKKGESIRVSAETLKAIAVSVEGYLKADPPTAQTVLTKKVDLTGKNSMTCDSCREEPSVSTGDSVGSRAVKNGRTVARKSGKAGAGASAAAKARDAKSAKDAERRAAQLAQLRALPSGLNKSEIAKQLGVSRATVRSLLEEMNK